MKLNLGCRNIAIPGFSGMDIDPHAGVDYVGDVSDLSRFKDNSIDEIYASHILEHFPHTRTEEVLIEWNRVIIPGGKLYLAVPDFEKVVEIYRETGLNQWICNYLWGDQKYKTAFHYTGFDESQLTEILNSCGFQTVLRADHFGLSPVADCSDISIGAKDQDGRDVIISVSLNLVAVK